MDILTHTASGLAVGTVVASISKGGFKHKASLILMGGLGGAIPDLDAISLWSGFDDTIGSFLGLEKSGRTIYTGKFWYSHHSFTHSIPGALLISFISLVFGYTVRLLSKRKKKSSFVGFVRRHKLKFWAFFFGMFIHILEDMPTPTGSWGGVNLLWPSDIYIGGMGRIWWWNNYDLFLIVMAIIITNLLILGIGSILKKRMHKICSSVFGIGILFMIFQIATREHTYNYEGRTLKYSVFELQSKQEQRRILGDELYEIMKEFDNSMNLNF